MFTSGAEIVSCLINAGSSLYSDVSPIEILKVFLAVLGLKDSESVIEFLISSNAWRISSIMFCATGVTDGSMLKGVKFFGGGAKTHSLVMRSNTGTIRFIETVHDFTRKPYSF